MFYDQHDPWMVSKLLAWMFLALLGLAIHEYRPFKVRATARQFGLGRLRQVLLPDSRWSLPGVLVWRVGSAPWAQQRTNWSCSG